MALTQESFNKHTLFVASPRFSSLPRPNSVRLSHEVEKMRRLSKASPPPSTRSQQKTQAIWHDIHRLRVSFAGRTGGRSARPAETGQSRTTREHKKAVGRCACTGPQPFGQNSVLISSQVDSLSRPNLRSHQLSELRYLRCSPHRPGSNRKPYAASGRWPRSGETLPRRAAP